MSKKKKSTYSMKFKQLSDIPQGPVMSPDNHSADNLAVRGQVPLGKSGEAGLSPLGGQLPGGGTTG
jgi:hypothetical protein